MDPTRVLYLESSSGTGGSVRSLQGILQHLSDDFVPTVLAHERNISIPVLQAHAQTLTYGGRDSKSLWRIPLVRKASRIVERCFPLIDVPFYNLESGQDVKRIEEIIDRIGPSLIHLNIDPITDFAGIIAARNKRLRCICHLRSTPPNFPGKTRIRIANETVSVYIANSQATKWHWVRFGLDATKIITIYNGLSPNTGGGLPFLRRKYNIPAHFRIIGCLGRFVSWKGQSFALHVFQRLLYWNRELVLVLVGDGPQRESLVQEAKRLKLSGNVVFTGFVEDVKGVFADIDVAIVPSAKEPFGRVVLEAMLNGVPVVATRVGGIPEIIEHGHNGFLTEYGDVDKMSTYVQLLLEDDKTRRRIAENGKRTVRERFDLAQTVRQIEKLYRSLLS